MKKLLLIILLNVWVLVSVLAQCTSDPIYTSLSIPGVYPPAVQIPNVPLPLGIIDGSVGVSYAQPLTLVVLEDTTMDIGFLLPAAAVTAMNTAGMSTVMSVDVNYVTFDVQGLPNGISFQCDIASCQYPSATDGCIQLSGIPSVAGTFSVPVNMTINIQLPSINIPIFGSVGGMGQDIPTYAAQTYDLFIDGNTSINEGYNNFKIFPNPTSDKASLFLEKYSDVMVFNTLGEKIINISDVKGDIQINKDELGVGLFFISISSEGEKTITKLIIK